jgi:hypothetical protein
VAGYIAKNCPKKITAAEAQAFLTTDEHEEEERAFYSGIAEGKDLTLETWEAGLDTQASINISGQLATFSDTPHRGPPLRVRGIGEKRFTDRYATVPVWGEVACVQGAPLLLSWSKISEKFTISWLQTENIIIVEVDSVEYIFRRRNNIYVCDMRASLFHMETALASTVDEYKTLYSKAEAERAQRARELANTAAAPPIKTLARILTTGMIQGTDLTPTDLHRAVHIFSPSLISIRGGTRRHPAPRVKTDTLIPLP